MKTGVELIYEERQRQIFVEVFSPANNRNYINGELTLAAVCYALPANKRISGLNTVPDIWPWGNIWWKPTPENRIMELQKAGALIAAEIDRILSLSKRET